MESTRRIVMFNWMTANGYFAGADGNLDWVVPDQEQAKAAAEAIPLFDTALFGRRTYELFDKFWSHAVHSAGPSLARAADSGTPCHSEVVKRYD